LKIDRITAAKCELEVNGEIIRTIIDTGAATNIITNKLRKRLNIPIREGSNAIFSMANGNKVTPLGKVKVEMEIDEDMTIPIVAHVIESGKEDLLLGSEWFVDMKGNIDFGKRKLTVEHKDEKIEIPIYFTRNEDIESESSEESSDEENNTEESENEYEKYEENEELEAYQVDEYEKEMWEEIKDKKEEERTETYLNNENDKNDENDKEFNKN